MVMKVSIFTISDASQYLTMNQPSESPIFLQPCSKLIQFPIHPQNPGNSKLSEIINNYVKSSFCSALIGMQDELHLNENEEYLKRFYSLTEFPTKIQLLSEYYKFHEQFPRIFIKDIAKIMEANVDDKRNIEYQQVKRKMKENTDNQPFVSGRPIQPQERLLADISLSYEDFQNKDIRTSIPVKKQLKRVVSVHAKNGLFGRECKQGLFLQNVNNKQKILNENCGNRNLNVESSRNSSNNKANNAVQGIKKSYRKESHKKAANPKIQNKTRQLAQSTNVSVASSLSRSKSKSNLHVLQSIKSKGNASNPYKTQQKPTKQKQLSLQKKQKLPSNTLKSSKTESCKVLRIKTNIGITHPNLNQKSKKSIGVQQFGSNRSITILVNSLSNPVNNMFNKVIKARKR